MLHFEIYIDDETREMTVIQIHPDEESLMLHMQLAGDRVTESIAPRPGVGTANARW